MNDLREGHSNMREDWVVGILEVEALQHWEKAPVLDSSQHFHLLFGIRPLEALHHEGIEG
jgi:hypothetical protein